jgi:zinc protease
MATRSSVAAPFAGLLFACCLLVAGRALAAPDDFESRVTEFRLKNGLQVLIYVDSSAPIVSTNVYYRVGSYYEPAGRTGISHMLEHMTFKHTPLYRPGEFFKLVQARGGRNNGMTMTYATGYFENFAGDRWEQALAIEAARMAGCIFDSSEFASEHQVVIEEQRRQDDHPFSESSASARSRLARRPRPPDPR